MIAYDTSTFARALAGERDRASRLLRQYLATNEARMPPAVMTELLSNPALNEGSIRLIRMMPALELHDGYWARAGALRRSVLALGLRGNLGDTLIAQSCIDHDIPLITYDRDFRHFVPAGLKLA
ncbi:MAG TPA: PIN domain-containing protein [Thermoanaerobaculia bacterium]